MASQRTESALSKKATKTEKPEETSNNNIEAVEDETAAEASEDAVSEEPRSGSLSSLLRRLEDDGDVPVDGVIEPASEESETKTVADQLSEMNDLLLQSETGDDGDTEEDVPEPLAAASDEGHSRWESASNVDDYWGPDGFEKVDEAEVRPDNELMSLINELNGKLDRAHDVIARSLPLTETVPETPAFTPPEVPSAPSVFERKFLPNTDRIREVMMFTGMWGALLAAVIAVVYSQSWWLTESPVERDQASAVEIDRAPARTQSLNRLGALGGTALSMPEAPNLSPSGSEKPAEQDAANEPRRPPRPATPDGPATSGDSATDVISKALAAGDFESPSGEAEQEEMPTLDDVAPVPVEKAPEAKTTTTVVVEDVVVETKPKVVKVTAPTPETRRVARLSNRNGPKPALLAPIEEPDVANSVTAVSEWRRVARATLGTELIREAEKADDDITAFSVGVVRGKAGQAISVPIRLPSVAKDTEASIMIRGLPVGSQLSKGEQAGQSTWILAASDVDGLMLLTPKDLGETQLALEVTLVTSDGAVPNTKLLTIELAAADPAPKVETVVVRTSVPDAPITIPLAGPTPQRKAEPANPQEAEAAELLGRGQELMQIGDIAGARLVLGLAAELESVDAMVTLAMTYDPVHLTKLRVRGIRPDISKAIAWYRRASEQGDNESGERAEALVASLRQ